MREPLQELRGDSYERPNQPWVCGLAEVGGPCPLGPGKWGRCPKATACHPVLEGDRWRCNRSEARGGPCEEGPSPEGECAHVYRCTPLMSLRRRRGRFVFAATLLTLGAMTILLSADWRNAALAPGDLSQPHAQLFQRHSVTERCASCHAAGTQTLVQWLRHATDSHLTQPTQTELCMNCHRNRIQPESATWAHNVDPQVLLASGGESALPPEHRSHDPTQPLPCSACHREHHGAAHDLTWMSDAACQACHREQYHSFSTDHPEFTHWPAARRTRIAFDHGAHEAKHFVKKNREFDCALCHAATADGAFQRTLPYETACAECHDSDIAASWDAGLEVFALPMLDLDALEAAEQDVGQWPEEATGEFDGALPPITKLLFAVDQRAAEAMQELGADFDFFDVDPEDPEQLAAAADVVWATKELLYDITTDGQAVLRARVEALVNRELSTSELADLAAHLAPENVAAITRQWLTRLPQEIAERRQTDRPAPLEPVPGNLTQQDRQVAQGRVEAGGWFRDDLTLSIRYRPAGHADPFVTAWIDLLVEVSQGEHSTLAVPLLQQQMLPTAPGLCGSCHSLDCSDEGRLSVNWFAKQPADRGIGFTVFQHGPHLSQAELADCRTCHAIDSTVDVMANYRQTTVHDFIDGFQPLTRADCAECHTPGGAGDSCLECHRYHVGGP
ncbi:MAG: cytochrome c3 family protein [Pirellulales bacterium]|nr:cytochrome c3 family protein [Pirellulales bacterium]